MVSARILQSFHVISIPSLQLKMINPYVEFVASFARLARDGKQLPLGGIERPERPVAGADAPVALIFSPHPDDECVIGALPLRLRQEAGFRVVNIAVTQGSNRARQAERFEELKSACAWIGFELEQTAPNGLERIQPKTRETQTAEWSAAVATITSALSRYRPKVVFFPHVLDWNGTHVGTHLLVVDALASLPADFTCFVVETEYWGQNPSPNLMVESSESDVAQLLAALSFHAGEVRRNPFHLRMPAWMQDNVRRGAEVVGGQGGTAPDFDFATLYRLRRWQNGALQEVLPAGRSLATSENPSGLFAA
jgi:LmbE family N-acetylglucosaminyl deacetylase